MPGAVRPARSRSKRPPLIVCPSCKKRAWVKDRAVVTYVDLPFGGVPMSIRWRKQRLRCPHDDCPEGTFTLGDHRIAALGCMLTTRAAKWVVKQIGGGQTVVHLARELACSWDAVNAAMRIYGAALLAADTKRLKHGSCLRFLITSMRAPQPPPGISLSSAR